MTLQALLLDKKKIDPRAKFTIPLVDGRGTLSASKHFICFHLASKSPKRRQESKGDWMVIVYKVLQNVSLDVQFVLHLRLIYSFTLKPCHIELRYFDIENFYGMFPVTFNAL